MALSFRNWAKKKEREKTWHGILFNAQYKWVLAQIYMNQTQWYHTHRFFLLTFCCVASYITFSYWHRPAFVFCSPCALTNKRGKNDLKVSISLPRVSNHSLFSLDRTFHLFYLLLKSKTSRIAQFRTKMTSTTFCWRKRNEITSNNYRKKQEQFFSRSINP